MSENTQDGSKPLDMLKWLVGLGLLGSIVAANTMYQDVSVLYRALVAVVVVLVAGFILATTAKGSAFLTFAKDSRI
jgi:preprotein translocase subunit SecE